MILNVANQEHVRQSALRKEIFRPISKASNKISPAMNKQTVRECHSIAVAPKSCTLKNEFLVSKEAAVLRQWESETWKFGFIKRVDKGRITSVKDLESWRFER